MRAARVPPNLDALLVAFLRGDCDARNAFAAAAYGYLVYLARRHAPHLPRDVREEVVSQVFAVLLRTRPRFDTARSSGATFLVYFVKIATRDVSAQYTPPGQRTRVAAGEARDPPRAIEQVRERDLGYAKDEFGALEARDFLEAALPRKTSPEVASALARVYGHGESIADVANDARVSRSTLSRRLARVVEAMRAAA